MSDTVLVDMFDKKLDLLKLKQSLDKYTEEFFHKYIKSYAEDPLHRPQAQILIAVQPRASLERTMFRVNDNVLLDDVLDPCLAVGKGAPMFASLAGRLLHGQFLDMKQAAAIAIYILRRVKLEVPGCGGNSHVLLMGSDGSTQVLTTRRITELELYHGTIEPTFYENLAAEIVKEVP